MKKKGVQKSTEKNLTDVTDGRCRTTNSWAQKKKEGTDKHGTCGMWKERTKKGKGTAHYRKAALELRGN